jgi:hypothetical protein
MVSRAVHCCALLLAGCAVSLVMSAAAFADVSCKSLAYGSAKYFQNMDELARQAKLPDAAWDRNHETVVSYLCSGQQEDVDQLVESRVLPAGEAERIGAVLGKVYRSKQGGGTTKDYASVKAELIQMGLCNACADDTAQHYLKKPGSQCARLAKRALEGDSRAIDELATASPDFCQWKYE